jgi:hypothetical protein
MKQRASMGVLIHLLMVLISAAAWGAPKKPAPQARAVQARPAARAPSQPAQGQALRQPASSDGLPAVADRSTSIDFEDDIIEGMNKNPFDSLTRVGRQDGGGGGALYRRKRGFGREIKQTVREMGFAP